MKRLAEILLRVLEIQERTTLEIINLKKNQGTSDVHLKTEKDMLKEIRRLGELVEKINSEGG